MINIARFIVGLVSYVGAISFVILVALMIWTSILNAVKILRSSWSDEHAVAVASIIWIVLGVIVWSFAIVAIMDK